MTVCWQDVKVDTTGRPTPAGEGEVETETMDRRHDRKTPVHPAGRPAQGVDGVFGRTTHLGWVAGWVA